MLNEAMLRRLFQLILVGSVLATLAAWLISVEMVETWVYTRSRDVQAALAARERMWLIRGVALPLAVGAWLALRYWPRTEQRLSVLASEFLAATRFPALSGSAARFRSTIIRVAVAGWLLLAVVHWEAGVRRVIHEWPLYGFASGERVLPKMSSSNRDIIHGLDQATEPDSTILCFSDQTLYFVSYYSWPRVVLQRAHPGSEFLVPNGGLSQRRAAYRLSDFKDAQINKWNPDYVLEYYAGAEFVDQDPVQFDPRLVSFLRRLYEDPVYVPECPIRLRRIAEVPNNP